MPSSVKRAFSHNPRCLVVADAFQTHPHEFLKSPLLLARLPGEASSLRPVRCQVWFEHS